MDKDFHTVFDKNREDNTLETYIKCTERDQHVDHQNNTNVSDLTMDANCILI